MTLRGYTAPLSPDGRAGIVPPPPWHYSGDFLVAEYRTDPDAVAALLPPELEPAEDPGAMAAIFADWQSCSADLRELTDPIRSQYREFFLVAGARFEGAPVTRCVYIWVDKDFAMYRGWIQGFPKKLGSIHMTRLFCAGRATPVLAPGARFGATCTAADRQIARLELTLEHESKTGPVVSDPPMHNTRHFPAASGPVPDVFELVRAGGYDREVSTVWEGSASLRLYDDTIEDLSALAPREMLRGYRFSFGYTVDGVQVVAQHERQPA
ncbi:MAG TPA: acetoacetate decarboxylase family protein [Solirubrobacteraceae bacterium]|nr:acetoacetate decarboxylase family protein [Solirubrobacteraceae bacterium]